MSRTQRLEPPARLLVVDSEDIVRVLMARILRECGYDVVEAANGRVAMELLDATPSHFDLIVTNSHLPGLEGYDFISRVRLKYPRLRVLHVSGHPDHIDDPRIGELGIPTLEKPFESRQLTDAVARSLHSGVLPERAGAYPDAMAEGSHS